MQQFKDLQKRGNGKGKRKVHLNFCQHLFLKLSELTFISNQEISINPFLSEK